MTYTLHDPAPAQVAIDFRQAGKQASGLSDKSRGRVCAVASSEPDKPVKKLGRKGWKLCGVCADEYWGGYCPSCYSKHAGQDARIAKKFVKCNTLNAF